jgi:hypothetical protein
MRTTMALLLGTLLGAPLLADDVLLKNGRSFENVVVENSEGGAGDSQVRIHIPGGVLSLPRSAIERVKKADSSFVEYLRRKQELDRVDPSRRRAEDWLELARWARRNSLPQGEREAALAAAEIDPRAPGLAALLRGFGYVYEASLDRWISYDDSMRLHGFVQDGGTWVSREEHAERMRERREQETARLLAARDAAYAAASQMQAAQQGGYDYGSGGYLGGFYGYWPFGTAPIFAAPGFGARRGHERHRPGSGGGEGHHGRQGGASVFGVPGMPAAPSPHTSFAPPAASRPPRSVVFGR